MNTEKSCPICGPERLAVSDHDQSCAEEPNAALAAIKYALDADEGMVFLRLWYHGDFDAIRREWEDVPREVFVGADPLLDDEETE